MSALNNVPLKWRLLIGGQVLITAGLMVHRMETMSSMKDERVMAGEGRFAPPPAVEQPDSARRKEESTPTGRVQD
ncbi:unnamed protein product [Hapterophycus canaliculatus]